MVSGLGAAAGVRSTAPSAFGTTTAGEQVLRILAVGDDVLRIAAD